MLCSRNTENSFVGGTNRFPIAPTCREHGTDNRHFTTDTCVKKKKTNEQINERKSKKKKREVPKRDTVSPNLLTGCCSSSFYLLCFPRDSSSPAAAGFRQIPPNIAENRLNESHKKYPPPVNTTKAGPQDRPITLPLSTILQVSITEFTMAKRGNVARSRNARRSPPLTATSAIADFDSGAAIS